MHKEEATMKLKWLQQGVLNSVYSINNEYLYTDYDNNNKKKVYKPMS